MKQDGITFLIY